MPSKTTALTVLRCGAAALALFAISACNSGSDSADPAASTAAPASSAPSSAAETSAPETSAPETSAPETSAPETSAAGEVPKACEALTQAEFETATGAKVTVKAVDSASGSACSYTPADPLKGVTGSSITVKATSNDLDAMASQTGKQLGDLKIEDATVAGADDAKTLSGDIAGMSTVSTLVIKGGVYYQVTLVQAKGDVATLKSAGVKAAEAMIG